MKTYPALFTAIGGQDGMDVGGVYQMTCAIYRTQQPWAIRCLLFGMLGLFFHCNICVSSYNRSDPFHRLQTVGIDGWQWAAFDDLPHYLILDNQPNKCNAQVSGDSNIVLVWLKSLYGWHSMPSFIRKNTFALEPLRTDQKFSQYLRAPGSSWECLGVPGCFWKTLRHSSVGKCFQINPRQS